MMNGPSTFVEIGNQTMTGILSGCAGVGPHNSVKPTQCHTFPKMGKVPHTSEKNVEMIIKWLGIPTDCHNFGIVLGILFYKGNEEIMFLY